MRMDSHVRIVRLVLLVMLMLTGSASAQETVGDLPNGPAPSSVASGARQPSVSPPGGAASLFPNSLPNLTEPKNFSAALQIIILLTVLSLAPAILIMMTSFTRIVIVLSLLRQALGTQQLPPNQVLIGLSLFMTFVVMGDTWKKINDEALAPYMNGGITQQQALDRAVVPLREFMIRQIKSSSNEADIDVFTDFAKQPRAKDWGEVNTTTLIPAFMLSELKTAFLMGFKVYLPFLIVDIVISSMLISMGMMMLPPVLISLPFKLLLFVLVDGWHLITASLMGSFS